MRRTAVAVATAAGVLLGCGAPQVSAPVELPHFADFSAAKEFAAANGRLVLLDFYTDW